MLQSIVNSMFPNERVRFEISQDGKGEITMVLTPILSGDAESIPDAVKSLRAALSAPLIMRGTSLEVISQEFMSRVDEYAAGRKAGHNAMDEILLSISEAAKQAANEAAAAKNKTKPKKEAKATACSSVGGCGGEDDDENEGCGSGCDQPEPNQAASTPPTAPKANPASMTSLFDV